METLVTIVSVLGGLVGLGGYLHADLRRVEARLEAQIGKLDDRLYALATGLKPMLDGAARSEQE